MPNCEVNKKRSTLFRLPKNLYFIQYVFLYKARCLTYTDTIVETWHQPHAKRILIDLHTLNK